MAKAKASWQSGLCGTQGISRRLSSGNICLGQLMEWELSRTASSPQALFLLLREAETARVGGGPAVLSLCCRGRGRGSPAEGVAADTVSSES